jgi:hypothetical protein
MENVYAIQNGSNTTGVEENKAIASNTWDLYPNPNAGSFSITNKNISQANSIRVIDILGREIEADINKNNAENKISIKLNEVREGYYFVIIKNQNGENSKLKFNVTNN